MNNDELPIGLRKPWRWIQPANRAELIQRLLEARDLNVHERERENLCSCAYEALRACQHASDEAIYTKADAEALCKIAVAAATLHAEDMVLVPREPTKAMLRAAEKMPAIKTINAWCGEMQIVRGRKANWNSDDPPLAQAYRAMLAAVQSGKESK